MTARAVVVGAGSIGQRHREVLEAIGLDVRMVSRRDGYDHADLASALAVATDYVVVANETAAHRATLGELDRLGFAGIVLVEKPAFAESGPGEPYGFSTTLVGYNLRFHPVLQKMRDLIATQPVLAVRAEVGQHLADWRPGRDYRQTYSASRDQGGGVLRDLSHEIDYLTWIFGPCTSLAAQVSHTGRLGIETDDIAALLMRCNGCPSVQLSLDYWRRPASRSLVVITETHTIQADVIAQTVILDGVLVPLEDTPATRNATYEAMHRAALSGAASVCSLAEGLGVLAVIEAAEKASQTASWVEL